MYTITEVMELVKENHLTPVELIDTLTDAFNIADDNARLAEKYYDETVRLESIVKKLRNRNIFWAATAGISLGTLLLVLNSKKEKKTVDDNIQEHVDDIRKTDLDFDNIDDDFDDFIDDDFKSTDDEDDD